MPKEVEIIETPFEELQTMRKEIDLIRQREDPTYQGAFHERKGSKRGGGKKRSSSRKRR
jgi:ATP-dependent RNA helicase RhlE